MQLGIRNEEAARIALDGGLDVVMDRCVKIEHARILGGLNWAGVNTGVISARRPIRLGRHVSRRDAETREAGRALSCVSAPLVKESPGNA